MLVLWGLCFQTTSAHTPVLLEWKPLVIKDSIGEIGCGAYWWKTELSKGGLTNRLAFLDWLINELEKSKTIK